MVRTRVYIIIFRLITHRWRRRWESPRDTLQHRSTLPPLFSLQSLLSYRRSFGSSLSISFSLIPGWKTLANIKTLLLVVPTRSSGIKHIMYAIYVHCTIYTYIALYIVPIIKYACYIISSYRRVIFQPKSTVFINLVLSGYYFATPPPISDAYINGRQLYISTYYTLYSTARCILIIYHPNDFHVPTS